MRASFDIRLIGSSTGALRSLPDAAINDAAQLLLTLRIGGAVMRLTDGQAISVSTRNTNSDGPYRFDSGLQPVTGIERSVSWFSGAAPQQSVSVSIVSTRDLAQVASWGVALAQGTAELAQIYSGQEWEDRRVLVYGCVSDVLYGDVGEVVQFAITEQPEDDRSTIISSTQRVTSDTFPRADSVAARGAAYVGTNERMDPNVLGQSYPVVIGRPGVGAQLRTAGTIAGYNVNAVPALYVERTDSNVTVADHVYLLAGHALEATTVAVRNVTEGEEYDVTVATGVDRLGQLFSYGTPDINANIPTGDNAELYCTYDDGGGLPDPYGPGDLRRADHIIQWALENSTLRIDRSMLPRLECLRSYVFDGFINDPALSNWRWLADNILPLLPVSVGVGADGVYVAPWNHRATERDAVAYLEEGRNFSTFTPISGSGIDGVVNDLTIEFGQNIETGGYAMWRQLTGKRETVETGTNYIAESPWFRASRTAFGHRVGSKIQTGYVWDPATAEQILQWQARAYSFPRLSMGGMVGREFDWLQPGDVVSLTHSGRSLSNIAAHVEGIVPQAGGYALALTWWQPMRYAKPS